MNHISSCIYEILEEQSASNQQYLSQKKKSLEQLSRYESLGYLLKLDIDNQKSFANKMNINFEDLSAMLRVLQVL